MVMTDAQQRLQVDTHADGDGELSGVPPQPQLRCFSWFRGPAPPGTELTSCTCPGPPGETGFFINDKMSGNRFY
ncbi:hypothetical protein PAL_GLEAN10001866 [Pteropus alecto]|uniref:Uncharacterized protein n=1 Tax=Pteropus alecto TaxID=9402 RepID=L5K9B1_PTEAL|nr:hypothetical protein PAL_GLEAN10001866 [Pteropus alecto]